MLFGIVIAITEFISQRCHVLGYCRTRSYIATSFTEAEPHDLFTGLEHYVAGPNTWQPPYCTLPIFHPPRDPEVPVGGHGYISADGHLFDCKSPAEMQRAFHVYVRQCLALRTLIPQTL